MGTLHEPVSDTENRSRDQADEMYFLTVVEEHVALTKRNVLLTLLVPWQKC